MIEYLPQEITA